MTRRWPRVAAAVSIAVAGALAGVLAAPGEAGAGDAVAGPLTSGDPLFPHQGNGGYDVGHYDLHFTWNPGPPGGTIDATTTVQATTTGQPLSSFGLDLQGLTVDSVTVDGSPATFARQDIAGTPPAPTGHKLVVTPATPVDGAFTVVVDYGGNPEKRTDTDGSDEGWIPTPDGASFMNQPIGSMTGFPNNDTPDDKATYTITVDVPAGVEVVSNGEPTLPLPNGQGARSTWVWTETRPMASELVLVGIGQFDVSPPTTINLSGGRAVPEWSFVDSALSTSAKNTFNAQRARLPGILTGLESFLGPYPGDSAGIVVDTTNVGYALETQDRPSFPTAGSVSGTLVHELTHQWYGDSVSPTVWNDLWINEGMATWAPVHAQAGSPTYAEFHGEWADTPAGSSLWTVPPTGITDPSDLFGWWSYDRGAMTYEALRTLIGDPAFTTLIRKWQTDFHGQSRGTADLEALAEQVSGQDLDGFFQDWLVDADKPAWPTPGQPPPPPPPTEPQPNPPGTIGADCRVTLSGRPRVGHRLRAHVHGCPADASFGYQWYAGDHPLHGADAQTYRVEHVRIGDRIRVAVTVAAPGYLTGSVLSPRTRTVR